MPNWPSDTAILDLAKPLIKQSEGFRPDPYKDIAGVCTIGYGTTRYPNGRAVSLGDPRVSESEADEYLSWELEKDLAALKHALTAYVPTAHQCAAMLSLMYNEGVNAICNSTLVHLLNEGDVAAASAQFLRWNKAHINGQILEVQGLTNRREEERTLFLTSDTVPVPTPQS